MSNLQGTEYYEQPEFRNGAGKPVVGLDIDGMLGDYHGHFLKFAEGWFGRKFPAANQINPGLRLSEFMGVEHHIYRDCKLAYRQGGLKRTMPAYDGANELTHRLRDAGAEVWICTTRPYLRLDNIDPDTREWLNRNNIYYDAVLFDDPHETLEVMNSKYSELVRQVGRDRIVAVADDLVEPLQMARQCGIKNLYLRDQPYNRTGVNTSGLRRHMRLHDIQVSILNDLYDWKNPEDS
jgi:phosphoglycolate phosphatase-like HAD superfamily hydrolase